MDNKHTGKCLFCGNHSNDIEPDSYQFCTPCLSKLERIGVDLEKAEQALANIEEK